jgi:predicted ester cyclase
MQRETLLTITRRAFDEVWSGANPAALDEIFAADYVFHDASSLELVGLDQFQQLLALYRAIFANLRFVIKEELVDGECVATRWEASSLFAPLHGGSAATDHHVSATGLTIDHVRDGKIVETWTNWDTLGLLQQIGAISEEEARSTTSELNPCRI